MIGHFDELLQTTADDGASSTLGLPRRHPAEELDELLEAWHRERQACVETGLLLDAAQDLLKRMLRARRLTPASRRKVTNLLLAIEAAGQGS
jgi:hypothetical protein